MPWEGFGVINWLLLQSSTALSRGLPQSSNEGNGSSRHDFSSLLHGFFDTESITEFYFIPSVKSDDASLVLEKKSLDEGLI